MSTYHRSFKLLALALLPVSGLVHASGTSFFDGLSSEDATRWSRTDGVFAGEPVNNAWRADHIAFSAGQLELRLNTQPCATAPEQCASRPSASGQLRSNDTYGFGRYTAVLKAAAGQGVVTDFMKYTGAVVGTPTDLVGMHIQGQDPTRLQVSYFLSGTGAQYHSVDLGFNASAGLHTYAFDWNAGALRWYVDNNEVFSVASGSLPSSEGSIVSDVWAASPSNAPLFGTYSGAATRAYFDSIAFEAAAAPVPEPATALMLTAGAGLLAWRRRRDGRSAMRTA
jgi:endo-1,3-1,4-beta-glycanase ExoK